MKAFSAASIKKAPVNRWIDLGILIFVAIFPLLGFKQFRVDYMCEVVAYMVFALSLDLIWGYTGLMSLGHAVLFGIGGYAIGICYQIQDGAPAFMTREGMMEVPAFFLPFKNPAAAVILGLAIAVIFAVLLGFFLFRSKVGGVFFTIITLALAQIAKDFVINKQAYTNGFNGLQGIQRFPINDTPLSKTAYYYVVLIMAVLVYLFCVWLEKSRFGKAAVSIRENEPRLQFLGYNSQNFKIVMFAISGFLAALSGILYAPMRSSITVEEISVSASTFILICLAVGGRGNLSGALLGTLIIQWAKALLSESFSNYWQLVLGALLLAVIFLMPQGIVGTLKNMQYNRSARMSKEKLLESREESFSGADTDLGKG